MSNTDPQRLRALREAPELTDALEAARDRLPDERALAALRARVEAAAAGSANPAKVEGRLPGALRIVLPLLGVAAVVVGAGRLARREVVPSSARLAPSAQVAPVPELRAEPAPNSTLPLPPPLLSAPKPILRQNPPPASAPQVSAPAPAAALDASSELDLIQRAGVALKSDPATALQLTMDHARLFPSGALAEEREVIAIEALARLGRLSAARTRAERFMLSFPRSAHWSRVEHAARLDSNAIDAGVQKKPSTPALEQ